MWWHKKIFISLQFPFCHEVSIKGTLSGFYKGETFILHFMATWSAKLLEDYPHFMASYNFFLSLFRSSLSLPLSFFFFLFYSVLFSSRLSIQLFLLCSSLLLWLFSSNFSRLSLSSHHHHKLWQGIGMIFLMLDDGSFAYYFWSSGNFGYPMVSVIR